MSALPSSVVVPFPKRNANKLRREGEAARERDARLKRLIDRAAAVLDQLEARAEACDREMKQLTRRKKLALARAERIENQILERMRAGALPKLTGNQRVLSSRPNAPKLEVLDPAALPREYLREKLVSEPDKMQIKAALARGEEVPGVELVQTISLLRS
jgi:Gp157 protein